jgi:C-terminal, D2-small domain, of ClpB protein
MGALEGAPVDREFSAKADFPLIMPALTLEHDLSLAQRIEYLSVQQLVSEPGVVLDIAILPITPMGFPARSWLANRGYDPAYGARPLKRVIQRHIQDPLAEQILSGGVKDGDRVLVSVRDGALTINGWPVKAAA